MPRFVESKRLFAKKTKNVKDAEVKPYLENAKKLADVCLKLANHCSKVKRKLKVLDSQLGKNSKKANKIYDEIFNMPKDEKFKKILEDYLNLDGQPANDCSFQKYIAEIMDIQSAKKSGEHHA